MARLATMSVNLRMRLTSGLEGRLSKQDRNVGRSPEAKQDGTEPTIANMAGAERVRVDTSPGEESVSANTLISPANSDTSVTRTSRDVPLSADTPAIEKSFGRYELREVLGQGAMGAVYLARDTQLDRDVALKVPKFGDREAADYEAMLERFYREARAAATLRSPNICPVYDVGEIDGQHYITMAYIEGRPLKDFTKAKKPHSQKQVATTVRKLALGLAEAHAIGVIHRDLKPANIMVDSRGEPVVMDFGLARRSDGDDVQVTQSNAILGTPAYMSPEQVDADHESVGPQADVYALGVIMYELLTGQMPFQGSLMSILKQIALNNPRKPAEIRGDVDPRLEAICMKMMAGDLQQRYTSMNDVAADLTEYLKNPRSKQAATANSPKPTHLPTRAEDSRPNLITIEEPKTSVTEQLRSKRGGRASRRKSSESNDHLAKPKWSVVSLASLAAFFGLVALLVGYLISSPKQKYEVAVASDDPSILISVDGGPIVLTRGQGAIGLTAGSHTLVLERAGSTGWSGKIDIPSDRRTTIRAALIDDELQALVNGQRPEDTGLKIQPATIISGKSAAPRQAEPDAQETISRAYALRFNKLDDYVAMPTLFDTSESLTIECQIQRSSFAIRAHSEIATFGERYGFFSGSIGELAAVFVPSLNRGLRDEAGNSIVPTTVFIAMVRDHKSDQHRLYINGELVDTVDGADNRGLEFFELCSERRQYNPEDGADYFFRGLIDELRISNVARYSASYTPEKHFKPDANTVALYHFDEGSGTVAKDSSRNGHHGEIHGATWSAVEEVDYELPDGTNVDKQSFFGAAE